MDDFGERLPGSDEFEFGEEIFHGRFSEVYHGRRRSDGMEVALKYTTKTEDAEREVAALEVLRDRSLCIVKLVSKHRARWGVTLALEYAPRGDLRAWMDDRSPKDPETILAIVQSMLEAVACCHSQGVVHRDVSPRNFLIKGDTTTSVVLADFGCSRRVSATSPTHCGMGTLWYMAPEVLFGSTQYTPAVDVWGVGCIAAELIRGQPLFDGSSQLDQICRLVETLGTPCEATWPGLQQLSDWSMLQFPERKAASREEIFLVSDGEGARTDPRMVGLMGLILDGMLVYNPQVRATAEGCLAQLDSIRNAA